MLRTDYSKGRAEKPKGEMVKQYYQILAKQEAATIHWLWGKERNQGFQSSEARSPWA